MNLTPVRDFWNSPASMNRFSGMLVGLSMVGLMAIVLYWMANRPAFVVKRVVVDSVRGSLKHVSPPQVHAAVAEALNGTVLSADLVPVHRALQSIPWVRAASVRRVWPNRLLVRIEEQHAVAIWANGRLVNDFGEAFSGSAADHEEHCRLIPLIGPEGSERLVLERARQISEWIAPMRRSLRSLTLSEQYAWTAELSDGLVMELGRDTLATPVEERVRMFAKTQSWLAQKLAAAGETSRLVKADLRYAIGYAFQLSAAGAASVATEMAPESTPLCIGVHT